MSAVIGGLRGGGTPPSYRRPPRKSTRARDDPLGKPMPAPRPGSVQMVVKLAVPAPALRAAFGK
ncbi:MAG: hypothetical protein K2X87_32305 [Gemmataceae bacterium]|nr:hypothetical protein [Gemmataceae bacterium]